MVLAAPGNPVSYTGALGQGSFGEALGPDHFDKVVTALCDDVTSLLHEGGDRATLEDIVRTQCCRLVDEQLLTFRRSAAERLQQAATQHEKQLLAARHVMEYKAKQFESTMEELKCNLQELKASSCRAVSSAVTKFAKASECSTAHVLFVHWKAAAHAAKAKELQTKWPDGQENGPPNGADGSVQAGLKLRVLPPSLPLSTADDHAAPLQQRPEHLAALHRFSQRPHEDMPLAKTGPAACPTPPVPRCVSGTVLSSQGTVRQSSSRSCSPPCLRPVASAVTAASRQRDLSRGPSPGRCSPSVPAQLLNTASPHPVAGSPVASGRGINVGQVLPGPVYSGQGLAPSPRNRGPSPASTASSLATWQHNIPAANTSAAQAPAARALTSLNKPGSYSPAPKPFAHQVQGGSAQLPNYVSRGSSVPQHSTQQGGSVSLPRGGGNGVLASNTQPASTPFPRLIRRAG